MPRRSGAAAAAPELARTDTDSQEIAMPHHFAEIAFTPTVKKIQAELGTRRS